jgi:hypothetical protein
METREELLRQQIEWARERREATAGIEAMAITGETLVLPEELPVFRAKARERIATAEAKLKEIEEKLAKVS